MWLSLSMACVIIFPDRDSFQRAVEMAGAVGIHVVPLEIPTFCRGIAPPCLMTTAGLKRVVHELESRGIQLTGAIPYKPFRREIPEAPPPDPQWNLIVGGISFRTVRPSFTDPQRLRIEAAPGNSLADLIPIMARLIRGGSFRPHTSTFAFEEEHRLIVFSPDSFVISRADDLLDAWIQLRCGVDLIRAAWNKRNALEPERDPRLGIGAIEIFRRLPGDNCGKCRCGNCMEFAQEVFTGRRRFFDCGPLLEPRNSQNLKSMHWLGTVIGIQMDGPKSRKSPAGDDRGV
ncbi:MAG: (Fe-S)-binding protein [Pseudomonadota bacterium]